MALYQSSNSEIHLSKEVKIEGITARNLKSSKHGFYSHPQSHFGIPMA